MYSMQIELWLFCIEYMGATTARYQELHYPLQEPVTIKLESRVGNLESGEVGNNILLQYSKLQNLYSRLQLQEFSTPKPRIKLQVYCYKKLEYSRLQFYCYGPQTTTANLVVCGYIKFPWAQPTKSVSDFCFSIWKYFWALIFNHLSPRSLILLVYFEFKFSRQH